jgi:AcrR family transcriptional regulator
MSEPVKKRRYTSTIARGHARAAVLEAAGRLFAEHGFLGTSIEDIAAAAGVARPTVFTAVGGKSVILKEVVDRALAGDDEPVPVSRRPWFRAMIDEPDPTRMLHLHAGNITRMYRRVGAVYCAVEAAADADPDVADLWRTLQRQRLAGAREVAAALVAKGVLRPGYDEDSVADVLWSVATPMVYRRTLERGWSPQRFEDWIGDSLCRLFLD